MKTAGWRGKGRACDAPWKLQARRINEVNKNKGYSMGGLPRARPRSAPTMPQFSCLKPEKTNG